MCKSSEVLGDNVDYIDYKATGSVLASHIDIYAKVICMQFWRYMNDKSMLDY